MDVLKTRTLLFGVYIRALDFQTLPHRVNTEGADTVVTRNWGLTNISVGVLVHKSFVIMTTTTSI